MSASPSSMRLLAVGGHTRSIGKTSLVVDLIRAFPEAQWTAVKITQFGHGICSQNGKMCGCGDDEHTVAIDAEGDPASGTDTSRFLAAGAARSFWLRTKQGRLAEGMPLLRSSLSLPANQNPKDVQNVIIESNSLLEFVRPELYLVVLDPREADFKQTALRFLDRADAFVMRAAYGAEGEDQANAYTSGFWPGVSPSLLNDAPKFVHLLGEPLPSTFLGFIKEKFFAAPNRW